MEVSVETKIVRKCKVVTLEVNVYTVSSFGSLASLI